MKKIYKIISITLMLCLCISFVSFAGREGLSSSGSTAKGITWKYFTGENDEKGYPAYLKDQWKEFEKGWCYFGADGLTSPSAWVQINEKWYYFNDSSIMQHDTTTPDGHKVGSDGTWIQDGDTAPVQETQK